MRTGPAPGGGAVGVRWGLEAQGYLETDGCHVWDAFCMQTVNEERRVAGVGWEAQGYVETGGCQVGVGVSPR